MASRLGFANDPGKTEKGGASGDAEQDGLSPANGATPVSGVGYLND
jgi:hypothetical protein